MLTAGRGDCSFYMANLQTNANSDYYTLEIYYSSDCGLTFTKYQHILSPNVGMKEITADAPAILISPNPAQTKVTVCFRPEDQSPVTLVFYNSLGSIVLRRDYKSVSSSGFSESIDLEGLPEGLFTVQLRSKGNLLSAGKLVKIK
jgi:hypothetical protein